MEYVWMKNRLDAMNVFVWYKPEEKFALCNFKNFSYFFENNLFDLFIYLQ